MVELGIFKVNQSLIWNGKQSDITKEKRNNHARIHFTFNCCPDVSKDTKRTGISAADRDYYAVRNRGRTGRNISGNPAPPDNFSACGYMPGKYPAGSDLSMQV